MEGQSLAHFLRQAKGRPQTGQTFSGRSRFFAPRTPPFYSDAVADDVAYPPRGGGVSLVGRRNPPPRRLLLVQDPPMAVRLAGSSGGRRCRPANPSGSLPARAGRK